jgi:hypothetical protein
VGRKANKEVAQFKVKKAKPKGIRYRKWQQKQLWEFRVAQVPEAQRKSFIKNARRMQRYAERGQLKNGVFYCKAGKPITEERVAKYTAMCHYMVRKFLPSLALWEAGLVYDDLINQSKIEVFLALLNGFDPEKAVTSTEPDLVKRAEIEARKRANLEETLVQAEQNIVFGRLRSYFIRLCWKYHPDQLGGRSGSLNAMLDGINQEFAAGLYTNTEPGAFKKDHRIKDERQRLLEILATEGPDAVRRAFFELHPKTQESLAEALRDAILSQPRWDLLNEDETKGEDDAVGSDCGEVSGTGASRGAPEADRACEGAARVKF